jgi:tetratricopeptide (TPR) repeat protein
MNHVVQKHIEYASGFLDLKMFAEALAEADAALALSPGLLQAIAIKAAVLWEQNRLPETEPLLARLAEIHPNDTGLWINLAYIRRRTQSVDAAVETLQHAFNANPRDPLAHFNMACYRAAQHRTEEALELLRNAIRFDPKLRLLARAEHDFDDLRELPAFRSLVEGQK